MKQHIENLIQYEIDHAIVTERDRIYLRNQLYHLLSTDFDGIILEPQSIQYPSNALEPILDQLEKNQKLDGSKVERDLMDAKIMNVFAKHPSDVEHHFYSLYQKDHVLATNWYYDYVQHLNYIRLDRIKKNVSFITQSLYGNLQITINLSKPEKDPKSIILAGQTKSLDYPKCVLCVENEGFSGNYNRDSRDNHRLIKLNLSKEPYYFQYSPYIYYNEHAIILSETHRSMSIDQKAFRNLLALCNMFDGYFFGSNADLPIVGGSILSHDHYQGGKHTFPIEQAKILKSWSKDNVTYHMMLWPLSTIRLESKNSEDLVNEALHILSTWKTYKNNELKIFPTSRNVSHQTITPIARKHKNMYQLDLILRNNYTDSKYPLGLYHPHEDKWHIKKENIGLIEAMGLAILPSRLKDELQEVKSYLLNGKILSENAMKHALWADQIKKKNAVTKSNIDTLIEREVGLVFEGVLEDCGVFKMDEIGIEAFTQFIEGQLL